jgi:hypothetical protein
MSSYIWNFIKWLFAIKDNQMKMQTEMLVIKHLEIENKKMMEQIHKELIEVIELKKKVDG